MTQFIIKFTMIGIIAGGYMGLVADYTFEAGLFMQGVILLGWLVGVVPTIYLTWRWEVRRCG